MQVENKIVSQSLTPIRQLQREKNVATEKFNASSTLAYFYIQTKHLESEIPHTRKSYVETIPKTDICPSNLPLGTIVARFSITITMQSRYLTCFIRFG